MPTLAERIQAALERHTAEVASILASASMAEVIAFTQSKGAVVSNPPAAQPQDTAPRPVPPPKWAVRRAEDERLTLSVLKFLSERGGFAPVNQVYNAILPKNMGIREFSRRITGLRKDGSEVISRELHDRFVSFRATEAGKQWLRELGLPSEPTEADTVSVATGDDVLKAAVDNVLKGIPQPGLSQEEMEARGLKLERGAIESLLLQGIVRVRRIQDVDYISMADGRNGRRPEAESGVLRDRLNRALAWLAMNPDSTLGQIAEGIGENQVDLASACYTVAKTKAKWEERVEVTGGRKVGRGVARVYRVKA